MQKKMRLTGIITQGASRMGVAEFIKAFKVASSFDGKIYTVHKADGQRKDKVTSQAHALRTQGTHDKSYFVIITSLLWDILLILSLF